MIDYLVYPKGKSKSFRDEKEAQNYAREQAENFNEVFSVLSVSSFEAEIENFEPMTSVNFSGYKEKK